MKALERLAVRLRQKAEDDLRKIREGIQSDALFARACTLEAIADELEATLSELRETERASS